VRIVTLDPMLARRVTGLVANYLDDADHDLDIVTEPVAIQAGTAMVLIRLVDADPPVLRVFSPLVRSVERGAELLAELNEINAHLNFLRLFWRDHTIFAATELLAESSDAAAIAHACDAVADLADYYDVRFHDRLGGELAYG
jgi:type III secretion system-like peptide-binding chaperone